MAANIATIEDLENIKAELIEEMRRLISGSAPVAPRQWMKSPEVRRLLSISTGTLQHLRVTGVLPFTKIGGVIYYAYDDIKAMIESRKSNAPKPGRKQKIIKPSAAGETYPANDFDIHL